MKKYAILVILLTIILASKQASAFDVFQIPSNGTATDDLAVDGDIVVYCDTRGERLSIYGYNISTAQEFPIALVGGTLSASYPDIDGDIVTWWEWDTETGISQILGKNLSSGQVFSASTSGRVGRPYVSGNVIIWKDYVDGSRGNITGYNISTGNTFSVYTGEKAHTLSMGVTKKSGAIIVGMV